MTKAFLVVFCLLMMVCWAEKLRPMYMVQSVHDGDTIKLVKYEGGRIVQEDINVRFADIDAKELSQPGQDGIDAQRAKMKLTFLVIGQEVQLSGCTKDKYGSRIVCTVYRNGQNINQEMVLSGHAFDYKDYSGGKYELQESAARAFHLGVWQQEDGGVKPWIFRKERKGKTTK